MAELFKKQRGCTVCGVTAPYNVKKLPKDQVSILAISATIYRRTRAGREQRAVRAVGICEPCLAVIAAEGSTARIKGRLLADALFNQIAETYKKMVECDDLAPETRERFKQLFKGGAR